MDSNNSNDTVSLYKKKNLQKIILGLILILLLIIISIYSICTGEYQLSIMDIINSIFGNGSVASDLVIWNIRIPRVLAATVAGVSLAVSGAVMQCVLRNPLASPYTMGVSHGAMFGACVAIMLLGVGSADSHGSIVVDNFQAVSVFAFIGSLIGVFVVLGLAKLRRLTPESMILAGVAMGSLFTAGTTLLQYFADEMQLAAMVYWTFGDLGRAGWTEITIMFAIAVISMIYFIYKRWDYNALESGEETAKSVGVNTERTRLLGMVMASLLTSICVSFLGIIGFIGLICPHLVRIAVGGDYRYLIPLSALVGAVIVTFSDLIATTIISPIVLPVGILTSFLGAPMFLYLLMRMYKK
ncbi:iron complex transport system permease protein [Methanococcus voltae]|uniref:FecCD family ABC transporter permease n=1 Tax=Methanococcus voltae TaxID=2188 RepID=UPI001AE588A2|nr:iron ABC transporter permease [Methanococcus voltae]MBP2144253.1 iron complex transport system permease protein [Methanococcus voltae]